MEEEGHAPVEVRSAADGTRRRPTPGTGWGMGVRLRERETAATGKLKEAAPFQGGPWGRALFGWRIQSDSASHNSIFLSRKISPATSQPANQQYFPLTQNQPAIQPASQPNKAKTFQSHGMSGRNITWRGSGASSARGSGGEGPRTTDGRWGGENEDRRLNCGFISTKVEDFFRKIS